MSNSLSQSNPSGSISSSASATDPAAQPDISGTTSSSSSDPLTTPANAATTYGATSERNTASHHHPSTTQQTAPINVATESDPLKAHHRPSLDASATQNSEAQGLAGETTIRRGNTSQNAPGKAGDVGEGVMGALGVGGAGVARPREEQGIGEKIVGFLGS